MSSWLFLSYYLQTCNYISIVWFSMQWMCCVQCEEFTGVPASIRATGSEVRVGPETQGCSTCFCLSLQREREREWLNACQVWTEWETDSRSRGILPRQRSIITCSTNLHGDWNVFFNNMQSWKWSLSSHSRPYRYMYHKHIPAPQTHTCAIPYVTKRRHVTVKYTTVPQKALRVQHKSIWEHNSLSFWQHIPRPLSGTHRKNKWAACLGWMLTEEMARRYLFSISASRRRRGLDRSLWYYRGPESPGRAALFCIETMLGPQRAQRTKEPAFLRLFLWAEIMKVCLWYTDADIWSLIALWENGCLSQMQTISALSNPFFRVVNWPPLGNSAY